MEFHLILFRLFLLNFILHLIKKYLYYFINFLLFFNQIHLFLQLFKIHFINFFHKNVIFIYIYFSYFRYFLNLLLNLIKIILLKYFNYYYFNSIINFSLVFNLKSKHFTFKVIIAFINNKSQVYLIYFHFKN
jgi:hypothetical protein